MKIVLLVLVVVCAQLAPALADEASDAHAKQLFVQASTAFEQQQYETAYSLFKQAYLLSPRPELLFNMASSLQQLDRPHEAAESLRAFLRVRPDSPERPEIEERIRALEEQQHLRDAESRPPGALRAAAAAVPPRAVVTATAPRSRTPTYKKWWPWTVVGVIVAAGATGAAIGIVRSRAAEPLLEPLRF